MRTGSQHRSAYRQVGERPRQCRSVVAGSSVQLRTTERRAVSDGGWCCPCDRRCRLVHRQADRTRRRCEVSRVSRRKGHRKRLVGPGIQHRARGRRVGERPLQCHSVEAVCSVQLSIAERCAVGDRRWRRPSDCWRRLVDGQRNSGRRRRVVRRVGRSKGHDQSLMTSVHVSACLRVIGESSRHIRCRVKLRCAQRRGVGNRRRRSPADRRRRLVYCQAHRSCSRVVVSRVCRREGDRKRLVRPGVQHRARGRRIGEGSRDRRSTIARRGVQLRAIERCAVGDRGRRCPSDCRCCLALTRRRPEERAQLIGILPHGNGIGYRVFVVGCVDNRYGIVDALNHVEVNAVRMHRNSIRSISNRNSLDDSIAVVGRIDHRDIIVILIGHIKTRAALVQRGSAWSESNVDHFENGVDGGRSRCNVNDGYRIVIGVGNIGARSRRIDCNIAR